MIRVQLLKQTLNLIGRSDTSTEESGAGMTLENKNGKNKRIAHLI